MSISRARSWPLLDPRAEQERGDDRLEKPQEGEEKKASKPEGVAVKKNCHPHGGSPQVQARRFLSRHYYPEGGWGWVVTVVSTLVNLLGPGLQLSVPATLAPPATVKFYHHPLHTAAVESIYHSSQTQSFLSTPSLQHQSMHPIKVTDYFEQYVATNF
ncbi:unnamed protein product [Xylocopa violacea]|uniref:Uncharacterized protein n=1 Tax=Xylocopa violacea TaxID=135666 RepID=A0ABP1NXZ2_XYLVO